MSTVIQHLADAVALGSLYMLVALGIGLILGVMRLINFAHGELIMAAGFALYLFDTLPWVAMVAIAIGVAGLLSVAMERIAFRPVRNADATTLLITSFALSFLLQNLVILTLGSDPKSISLPGFLDENISILGARVGMLDILTALTAALLVIGLTILLRRTSIGVEMRAAAEDFSMARLLGVRANRVIAAAFLVGGVLAGVAGVVIVGRSGTVDPQMGLPLVLIGFVATVVGGMSSLRGTAIAGFGMGCVAVALQIALPLGLRPFRDAFLFAIVILVLLYRPAGLFTSHTSTRV